MDKGGRGVPRPHTGCYCCKYNSICIKIFRSICIAAGLNRFTTVSTGYQCELSVTAWVSLLQIGTRLVLVMSLDGHEIKSAVDDIFCWAATQRLV